MVDAQGGEKEGLGSKKGFCTLFQLRSTTLDDTSHTYRLRSNTMKNHGCLLHEQVWKETGACKTSLPILSAHLTLFLSPSWSMSNHSLSLHSKQQTMHDAYCMVYEFNVRCRHSEIHFKLLLNGNIKKPGMGSCMLMARPSFPTLPTYSAILVI